MIIITPLLTELPPQVSRKTTVETVTFHKRDVGDYLLQVSESRCSARPLPVVKSAVLCLERQPFDMEHPQVQHRSRDGAGG